MTQIETAERNRHIIKLAKEGKTADEISEIIKIKRRRVLEILRAYNVKPAKTYHQLSCKMAQDIIKELEAGTRQIDIAKKIGCSRQYVNQIKKSYENLK